MEVKNGSNNKSDLVHHKHSLYILNEKDIPLDFVIIEIPDSGIIFGSHSEGTVFVIYIDDNCSKRTSAIEFRTSKIRSKKYNKISLVRCEISIIENLIKKFNEMENVNDVSIEESKFQIAFNDLLYRVIEEDGATDIHIECSVNGKTSIRVRIGGQLMPYHEWPGWFGDKVASVLFRVEAKKTLNDRDTLDANIKKHFNGQDFMLRLNYKPTFDGHDTIIRIQRLGKANIIPIENAGYSDRQIIQLRTAIMTPQRLVLLVGTTGSGKSSTLQSMISEQIKLNPYSKVITIEEPVEYIIDGARQSQVDSGLDFNKFLEAALRSDPDTMMLGEVRDNETAAMVEKATLTGHKMYTTLHANSVFAVIPRLEKLGIERSVMASKDFFNAIICQKLVPETCTHCSIPLFSEDKEEVTRIGAIHYRSRSGFDAMIRRWMSVLNKITMKNNLSIDNVIMSNPEGCKHCTNGLTRKRTVVAEILIPDMKVLEFIQNGDDFKAWQHWRKNGGITKLEHGIYKVLNSTICPVICERDIDPVTSDDIYADGVIECSEIEMMGGYIEK